MLNKRNTVNVSDHALKFAAEQIGNGEYASVDEVIEAGIRALEARQNQIKAFDAAIQDGLDSEDSGPFDINAFLSEMHA
jgi:putative addiction module CopG family antidote